MTNDFSIIHHVLIKISDGPGFEKPDLVKPEPDYVTKWGKPRSKPNPDCPNPKPAQPEYSKPSPSLIKIKGE